VKSLPFSYYNGDEKTEFFAQSCVYPITLNFCFIFQLELKTLIVQELKQIFVFIKIYADTGTKLNFGRSLYVFDVTS